MKQIHGCLHHASPFRKREIERDFPYHFACPALPIVIASATPVQSEAWESNLGSQFRSFGIRNFMFFGSWIWNFRTPALMFVLPEGSIMIWALTFSYAYGIIMANI